MESPFSICAQHRALHLLVHLVVPQRPCGLLSVEAVQFKRETWPFVEKRLYVSTCLSYLLAIQSTSLIPSRVSTIAVHQGNLVAFFNRRTSSSNSFTLTCSMELPFSFDLTGLCLTDISASLCNRCISSSSRRFFETGFRELLLRFASTLDGDFLALLALRVVGIVNSAVRACHNQP